MEAERKADEKDFDMESVPRHAAITMLPPLARELLTTLAVAGAEFELTPGVVAFIKELRKFNRSDLGETVNTHLDNLTEES